MYAMRFRPVHSFPMGEPGFAHHFQNGTKPIGVNRERFTLQLADRNYIQNTCRPDLGPLVGKGRRGISAHTSETNLLFPVRKSSIESAIAMGVW